MLASCVWADDSFQTFKRSLVTLLVLIAAVGIGKQWRTRELLLFVAIVTSTYLLIGMSAEVFNGSFTLSSVHRLAGTQHPNTQGVNCDSALASFALFAASSRDKMAIVTRMLWLDWQSLALHVCCLRDLVRLRWHLVRPSSRLCFWARCAIERCCTRVRSYSLPQLVVYCGMHPIPRTGR